MATSKWGAVVDGVVAALRATSGFKAPDAAGDDVPVYDGPEVDVRGEDINSYVVVGVPGDGPQAGDRSGAASQAFGPMASSHPRDEDGTIACRAVYQSGDVNTPAARNAALALVATVESALRTAPALGLDQSWMRWATVTGFEPRQYLSGGSVCEIDFNIAFKTRLT